MHHRCLPAAFRFPAAPAPRLSAPPRHRRFARRRTPAMQMIRSWQHRAGLREIFHSFSFFHLTKKRHVPEEAYAEKQPGPDCKEAAAFIGSTYHNRQQVSWLTEKCMYCAFSPGPARQWHKCRMLAAYSDRIAQDLHLIPYSPYGTDGKYLSFFYYSSILLFVKRNLHDFSKMPGGKRK